MSEWAETTLGAVCGKPQYGAIASGSDDPVGPLFIRQTDITSGRVDWSTVPYCDLAPDEFDKYAVARGDILISRLGAGVGNAATVREPQDAVFAGYLVRFRVDPAQAVGEYVGYLLQSAAWKEHVEGFRSGAAQPTLNAKQMAAFSFRLPSLSEQRRIAGVLGAFDDLIETNRSLMRLLSAAMGAAYNGASSRAKESGELREFVASVSRGIGPMYSDAAGCVEVLNQKCIRDGRVSLHAARRMTPRSVRAEKIAEPGDTLVNSTGVGTLGRAARWMGEAPMHVDSHVSVVKAYRQSESGWVARALIESQEVIEGLGSGSTGQTELSSERLLSLRLPIPSAGTRSRLGGSFDTIDGSVESLQGEIANLTRVRDELLPLLMSGRVRVREVA
ncbi:restriction endonuclease subunit S [Jatrophihabitans cynanchi]|uniref:Restriction endonuclease subunit S n=1 Tax=Jatrophihabitans cynanchi TaxID=2944128 RepID=A0ABY7JTU2_9ACTN|nr:restriction endonuclease subunit S [Jatrophihabitans sp. SB3-54]WAX55108.1 restriction endonuclease subunit S [Jatrophihabitans sp. SB3-54]